MSRSLAALLLVVACSPDRVRPAAPRIPPPAVPAGTPRAAAPTAPHGSDIVALAVTETGDAAVSCDAHDSCRLWPSLDGTQEPIVIADVPSGELAIVRDPVGFVVAVLDGAGGLAVLRYSADGRALGRAAILPDPGLVDVQLLGDTVIALASDQRVMLYRSTGELRGAIAAPADERISSLTVRKGRVTAALIRHGESRIDRIRALDVERLAWRPAIALPVALESLAVSPNGERLAGVGEGYAVMIALSPEPVLHQRAPLRRDRVSEPVSVQFLDDGHVLTLPFAAVLAWHRPDPDPWAHDPSLEVAQLPAVADGLVVSANGGSLVLASFQKTRYLGYRYTTPATPIEAAGARITFLAELDLLQLDARLRPLRVIELAGMLGTQVITIDDRRVVYAERMKRGFRYQLVDLVTKERAERDLGDFVVATTPHYEPATRVFAVREPQITHRYQLDPEKLAFTQLRSIATTPLGDLRLLDPRIAGGAIAVTTEPAPRGGRTIEVHYEDAPPTRVAAAGLPIGTDRAGVTHMIDVSGWVIRYQHGKSLGGFQVARPKDAISIELLESGAIVAHTDRTLVMLGSDGRERWQTPLWSIQRTALTDKTLVAATRGGMIAFDAATGERLASACGWRFGLHESPLQAPGNAPSVCTP
jgi:hypothetical protein